MKHRTTGILLLLLSLLYNQPVVAADKLRIGYGAP